MPPISIQNYLLTGPKAKQILEHTFSILREYLPISIPLYRRLQYGRFFDATCLLTNVSIGSKPPTNSPWLFAFVDRSCRPETEVWLFASWEIQDHSDITNEAQQDIDSLVTNLLKEMKNLGVPTSIHQGLLEAKVAELEGNDTRDRVGFSAKDYGGHILNPNIMLWGAIHERTVPVIERLNGINRQFKTGLVPNSTFIFDVDALASPKALTDDLKWGELQQKDFALVRSRTQIPRQDRTMALLPNLGIFPKDSDSPIAWAFAGTDASLTSLHVEPEWRGRGLAKAITTRLFKEKMDMFWQDGEKRLAHGYVIRGNEESEGMCRSLGGMSNWEVYWLRVDLGNF